MGCNNSKNHKKKEYKKTDENQDKSSKKEGDDLVIPQKSHIFSFLFTIIRFFLFIFFKKRKGIEKIGDVNFNISNFVNEKLGKINKDYTLLNPPIGKGYFSI